MDKITFNELNAKIDIIIEYLKNHGGIGYEIYSFICEQSHEEVTFDIVDIAIDIKDKIDFLYKKDSEDLPF